MPPKKDSEDQRRLAVPSADAPSEELTTSAFYQKENVTAKTERGTVEAMVYVMDPARPFGASTEW